MKDLKELKDNTNISDVIKNEGIEYIQEWESIKINCLFHKEDTPSMSITDSKWKFHCFGCKMSWDILNIIEALYPSSSFSWRIKYLKDNFLNKKVTNDKVSSSTIKKLNKEVINEIIKDDLYYEMIDFICSYFQKQLTNEIKDKYYLSKDTFSYKIYKWEKEMTWYWFNNSSIEKYRLGYSPNNKDLYKLLIETFWEDILNKYVIGDKLLWIFTKAWLCNFKWRLVFPIIKDWRVVSFTSRQTEFTPKDKHNIQKYYSMSWEREYLFNEDDLENNYVIITEWISDCISLKEHWYSSISIWTTSIPKNILNRITEELQDTNIYILLDNESNNSWDIWAIKLSKKLTEAWINNLILNLPLEEWEEKIDVNSYFKYNSKKDFMKLIWSQIM